MFVTKNVALGNANIEYCSTTPIPFVFLHTKSNVSQSHWKFGMLYSPVLIASIKRKNQKNMRKERKRDRHGDP